MERLVVALTNLVERRVLSHRSSMPCHLGPVHRSRQGDDDRAQSEGSAGAGVVGVHIGTPSVSMDALTTTTRGQPAETQPPRPSRQTCQAVAPRLTLSSPAQSPALAKPWPHRNTQAAQPKPPALPGHGPTAQPQAAQTGPHPCQPMTPPHPGAHPRPPDTTQISHWPYASAATEQSTPAAQPHPKPKTDESPRPPGSTTTRPR